MDMNVYYVGLGTTIIVLIALAGKVFFDRSAIFHYPTLVALLGLAWVVPQAIAIERLPVNDYATVGFWYYVASCFLFLAAGFRYAEWISVRRGAGGEARPAQYDKRRLIISCFAIASLGWISVGALASMDTAALGSNWTGPAAFFALLSRASGLALCLCVLVYFRTRSQLLLVLAILIALPMAYTAFGAVRRELLFDLALLSVGAWAFVTKRYPPRIAILAAALVGTVVINSAGNLRAYVASGEGNLVTALVSEETYTDFKYLEQDVSKANELRQAQYDHWQVQQVGAYDLGARYWNGLVQLYVPAFIVGKDVKESLKLNPAQWFGGISAGSELYFHGSTRTGFSDTYQNFGPFGVLVFFVIGLLFGTLYTSAKKGGLASQLLYLAIMAEGLKAVTHSTAEFFASLPFIFILILAALFFAQRSTKPRLKAPPAKQFTQLQF